ncbi:MAG: hypothetical protein O2968_18655 [Acidobacteria bacterium]|nr:hypothetical protein [Acidobacteriota bacterium]
MRLLAHILMGLLGVAGPLAAGALLTVEVEAGRGGVLRKHEIHVQGSRVRMDTPSDQHKQVTLYDNKAGTMVLLDEEQKLFRRIDIEQTADRQKEYEVRQARFQEGMEKRIRSLPPEKQAAFRKLMNRGMAAGDVARMECQRVGEAEAVGNWTADRYDCLVGSRKVREIWTVPWEESGLNAEEVEALRAFVQRRGGGSTGGPLGSMSGQLSLSADAFPGLAVRVRHFQGGAVHRGHEISSVKSEDFDAGLFAIDASYSEAAAGNFPLGIR